MCGIYGYVGKENAFEKVYNGLEILQYRGYDSCGIAYFTNEFNVNKAIGTLKNLEHPKEISNIAFGHTRWATNGVVNLENAHPHVSFNKNYVIVHNGIITNADGLKAELIKQNVKFYSDTDTEVIANLLANMKGEEEENIKSLFNILKGTFSLIIGNNKGELYLVKQFSPLNIVKSNQGIYISSDIASLKNGDLYSLQDGDILKVTNNEIISLTNKQIDFVKLENKEDNLSLGEHSHYMIKEIFETPQAILNTYNWLKDKNISFIKKFKTLTLLGCGTAYHSCLIGEYLLNKLERFKVNTSLESTIEINKKIKKNHLHIIVSQSGETADCIRVAESIKKHGGKILVITNQDKSSILKFADYVILTKAKKELAVASTKTYCAQVFVFAYIYNLLANKNYKFHAKLFEKTLTNYILNLNVDNIVNEFENVDKTILIAKDVDHLTMLEASLKIREINYIYTIPIISSELKHGTLSLIEEGSKILSLNTSSNSLKLSHAINEIKSRGGKVIEFDNFVLKNIEESFKPIFAIIPFQLFTYKLAIKRGLNPDMPRNLAKSVTVE